MLRWNTALMFIQFLLLDALTLTSHGLTIEMFVIAEITDMASAECEPRIDGRRRLLYSFFTLLAPQGNQKGFYIPRPAIY